MPGVKTMKAQCWPRDDLIAMRCPKPPGFDLVGRAEHERPAGKAPRRHLGGLPAARRSGVTVRADDVRASGDCQVVIRVGRALLRASVRGTFSPMRQPGPLAGLRRADPALSGHQWRRLGSEARSAYPPCPAAAQPSSWRGLLFEYLHAHPAASCAASSSPPVSRAAGAPGRESSKVRSGEASRSGT